MHQIYSIAGTALAFPYALSQFAAVHQIQNAVTFNFECDSCFRRHSIAKIIVNFLLSKTTETRNMLSYTFYTNLPMLSDNGRKVKWICSANRISMTMITYVQIFYNENSYCGFILFEIRNAFFSGRIMKP